MSLKIAFRVDSSSLLGSGHVMRCLTLAHELKKEHEIVFICAAHRNNLNKEIERNGFSVYIIPSINISENNNDSFKKYEWKKDSFYTINTIRNLEFKVDILITDHYMLDSMWETELYSVVSRIVVVDDLANRKHTCDLLIDQNLSLDIENKYNGLVKEQTKLLLGQKYVLLRDEFLKNKKSELKTVETVFIYFGASDLTNETYKVLKAYENGIYKFKLNVLLGYSNSRKQQLQKRFSNLSNINWVLQDSSVRISKIMLESDISIGAGGSTTWERCCIGLPSVVVTVAENQLKPMYELKREGVIYLLEFPSIEDYKDIFDEITNSSLIFWQSIQRKGKKIFDGLGKQRIRKEIERMISNGED